MWHVRPALFCTCNSRLSPLVQYGKVYKGIWRGMVVAVKQQVMPQLMDDVEKRERMAIMEAAISSTLCHPNIVQVGKVLFIIRVYCKHRARSCGQSGVITAAGRYAPQVYCLLASPIFLWWCRRSRTA